MYMKICADICVGNKLTSENELKANIGIRKGIVLYKKQKGILRDKNSKFKREFQKQVGTYI